jgi:hypothetical protein
MQNNMNDVMLLFSMQRAGQHALINWIVPQYDGKVVHTNCCTIDKETQLIKQIHNHKIKTFNQGLDTLNIFNFENYNLDHLENINLNDIDIIKNANNVYKIALIRDPYNWLASVIKQKERDYNPKSSFYDYVITLYLKYIKLVEESNDFYIISYNEWFKNESYRKQISNSLNLNFNDSGLLNVSSYGGGSSFDRKYYNGKAKQMNVLGRYQQLTKNELEIFNKHKEQLPYEGPYWDYK